MSSGLQTLSGNQFINVFRVPRLACPTVPQALQGKPVTDSPLAKLYRIGFAIAQPAAIWCATAKPSCYTCSRARVRPIISRYGRKHWAARIVRELKAMLAKIVAWAKADVIR
jgi:hypothetical protein